MRITLRESSRHIVSVSVKSCRHHVETVVVSDEGQSFWWASIHEFPQGPSRNVAGSPLLGAHEERDSVHRNGNPGTAREIQSATRKCLDGCPRLQ